MNNRQRDQNLITFKISYSCDQSLVEYIRQYNSLLKFTHNRLVEQHLTDHDINVLQKGIKNCDLVNNSWFRGSAYYDAKARIAASPDKHIIFGGKSLFLKRCQHKISKQEFQQRRLIPLYSIGEVNVGGNRFFKLIDEKTVEFRPDKSHKFKLELGKISKKRSQILNQLIKLQNSKEIAITYQLSMTDIYMTFDYNAIKEFKYVTKKNRVMAIDLNPNSIGWSVVDWKSENNYHIVQAGTFSLKPLNDYQNSKSISSNSKFHKYVTNKRNFEIIEIAKQLFKLCKYYHCEVFAVENLNIASQDNKLGKKYNKLVNNQWNRQLLITQIRKRIKASSTLFHEAEPQYSSYIGNLIFRKEQLPDECLSSIEIGRRAWEYIMQYIFKRRLRNKTVIFPDFETAKNQLAISLEEIGIDVPELKDWKYVCQEVKKSKRKYRFSHEAAQIAHASRLFSKFHKRRYLNLYEFI